MTRHSALVVLLFLTSACGGSQASGSTTASDDGDAPSGASDTTSTSGDSTDEFQLSESDSADQAHGEHESQITSTATHAALRLFVVDPDAGPTSGVVMKLTGADGHPLYTAETDAQGYAEVLVPVGQRYEIEYLSLGRRSTTAHVDVPPGPRQDIRLTLRYRRHRPPAHDLTMPSETPPAPEPEHLVLEGIQFDSNRATLQPDSAPRLDRVVEFMTHMPSVRIRISGHTDNVGDPTRNQQLSEERARAVREYLVSHGIDGGRIEAVGYGDQHPVATNDTDEGRQRNRRIEAEEL